MACSIALLGALLLAPSAQAVYPGTNGEIAFTAASGVAAVEPDGSGLQQLQPGGDPSWSPTGTTITYVCGGQVCEMNPDGSEPLSLTINGGADPQYTPGGDIVFVRPVSGFDQVFTMADEGGEIGLTQRTSDPRDHADPTYSATGQSDGDEQIAYAADGDIWTMGIGEDNATNLTHRYSLGEASHPDFSPDGSEIVFSAGGKLYAMNQDGSGIRQLTDPGESSDSSPVFAPAGGGEIAFSRTSADGSSRVMLLSGTIETPITPPQPAVSDAEPSWQPVVPPLFDVIDAENANSAHCPPGSVLLGGGHTGLTMGAGTGDWEAPTDDGGWSVVADANDGGYPVATFATCGSPTYFQTGSEVLSSDQVTICGPINPSTDCDHLDARLEVDCDSGEQVVAGGFDAFPNTFDPGTDGVGSTLGAAGGWRAVGWIAGGDLDIDAKGQFQAFALCLKPNADQNPVIATASSTEGPIVTEDSQGQVFWSWRAYCPAGSAPLAGGWERTSFNGFSEVAPQDDSYPDQFEPTDYGTLPTTWFFSVEIDGTNDPDDTAVTATCAVLPSGLEAPESNGSLTFVEGGGAGNVLTTGSPTDRLTSGRADDSQPQWLPDASGFVFSRARAGRAPELLVYNDANDSVSRPARGRLLGSAASYGPDLRSVAYARPDGGISLGSDVGTGTTRLTAGRSDRSPVFSPAGETIAFARGRGATSAIWTVDEEGEVTRRLTPRGLAASDPDWSPDGTGLLFTGTRGDCTAVYSIAADGGKPKRLTGCGTRDPAFAPNGKRIAYVMRTGAGSAIVAARPDGGGTHVVDRSRRKLHDPDWRPYPGRSGPRG